MAFGVEQESAEFHGGGGGSQSSPFPHASRVVGKLYYHFTFPERTISHMAPCVLLKERKMKKKSQHRFPLQSNMQKNKQGKKASGVRRKLPVLVKALGSVRRGGGASGAGQSVE